MALRTGFWYGENSCLSSFLEALWLLSWPPTLLEGFFDWFDWRSFLTGIGCDELLAQFDLAWCSLTFLKPDFPHNEQVAPLQAELYSSVLKYAPEVVSVKSLHLVQSSAPLSHEPRGITLWKTPWSRSLGCQPVDLLAISPAPVVVSTCLPMSFQSSEVTIPQHSTSLSL